MLALSNNDNSNNDINADTIYNDNGNSNIIISNIIR